jgi:hypothetical protein
VARGKQLSQVRESLQFEIRSSTSTSRGVDNIAYLNEVIRRTQELLYEEHWWPFLEAAKASSRKTLEEDQRYYDFPVAINRDRIKNVWTQVALGQWVPLEQGIGPEEYTAHDSDNDGNADPAQRWDWHGTEQFEVWPMPASDGGVVWFEALVPLTALTVDASIVMLDDRAIALRAAAEILAADEQKDAQAKLAQAQTRVNMLLGNVSRKGRVVLGGGGDCGGRRPTSLRVAYVRD